MKNFTLLCLLCLFNYIHSQDISDEQYRSLSDANKELYNKLVNQQNQREERVNSYLLINNVKRNHKNENGSFFHIYDVINGEPIYKTTDNVNAAIATKTDQLQVGGELGLNLDGTGMFVAVWDGGPIQDTHPEFGDELGTSRVTPVDFGEQYDGGIEHATHVAGTIAAKGVDPIAKGMATNVDLTSYDFFNDNIEMLSAVTNVTEPVYLSNHSYGFPVANFASSNPAFIGAYTQDSRDIDQLAFNNPKYLGVHSAGNDGFASYSGQKFPGLDKLTGNKTSKNTLVIANANPSVNNGNLLLVINGGSSQGPTDDLRVKPDLAADGTNLYSPTQGNTYVVFSGTSMAAPNTTGTLVLLQQYYSQLNNDNLMNSSTLKAVVCHTAVDDPAEIGPDPKFGWGFLDAKASAELIGGAFTNNAVLEELTLDNNDTYTYTFTAEAGSKLSATICWTDIPGAISNGILNDPTPALVNDLDLRITKDGTIFLPWRLSTSFIGGLTNSKGDNDVDNIERIDIDTPEAGEYTLTVSHKGTLQGASNNQNFSLVVTGNNLTLGTDDVNATENFAIYPNPNDGEFTVSFNSNENTNIKIDIYDISGRIVYSNKFDNSSSQFRQQLSLNGLTSGIYVANISEGNRTISKKIIIE